MNDLNGQYALEQRVALHGHRAELHAKGDELSVVETHGRDGRDADGRVPLVTSWLDGTA